MVSTGYLPCIYFRTITCPDHRSLGASSGRLPGADPLVSAMVTAALQYDSLVASCPLVGVNHLAGNPKEDAIPNELN